MQPDLGDDHLGGVAADAGDFIEPVNGGQHWRAGQQSCARAGGPVGVDAPGFDAAVGALPEARRQSPRAVLGAVAAAIAAHVEAETQTCRVLMEAGALAAQEPVIAAAMRAADAGARRQLDELFAAGVAAGEWAADSDPALSAQLFTAGLYGLMAQWHLAPGSFSWPRAAAALAASAAPAGRGSVSSSESASLPGAVR